MITTKYESKEEEVFSWALSEMKLAGYVDDAEYHPKPFILSEKVEHHYSKQTRKETILVPEAILQPHSYQADWLIWWNNKAIGIFCYNVMSDNMKKKIPFLTNHSNKSNKEFSVIDIKGTFIGPHNNSAISFPLDQKWVYAKYKLYVQKIIPVPNLFEKTFTPDRYLVCDVVARPRKINHKVRTLKDFLRLSGVEETILIPEMV